MTELVEVVTPTSDVPPVTAKVPGPWMNPPYTAAPFRVRPAPLATVRVPKLSVIVRAVAVVAV